jgi:hypothetical protein
MKNVFKYIRNALIAFLFYLIVSILLFAKFAIALPVIYTWLGIKKLIAFVKVWPEVWSLPASVITWLMWPFIIARLDPRAGTFDNGVLQVALLAALLVAIINGLVFFGIKINWPGFHHYYKYDLRNEFITLKTWQRILIFLGLYCFLFLQFVLLMTLIPGATAKI